jgi:hypothetical protein
MEKVVKPERFIPGIFNYCDYWCDRCPFTQRCRNFAMGKQLEREAKGIRVGDDATQQAFWEQLAGKLRDSAMTGAGEGWMDNSADPCDREIDKEYTQREEAHRKAVDAHPLVGLAHTYMLKATDWLKVADGDLKRVGQDLLRAARESVIGDDFEEQALSIGDMIEVVAWYHTLIPPKVGRAVGGLLESQQDDGVLSDYRLDDANGTGRVALMAIERSMAAWLRLREIVPEREDGIIEMLALLKRIEYGLHAALPGAKAFVRPGFDELSE